MVEVTAIAEPLPIDLYRFFVQCVEGALSWRKAAARFKIAPSSVVNLLRLLEETGSVEPRPRVAASGGNLKPHREFILGVVERQPDATMPELAAKLLSSKGMKINPSNLSKSLITQVFSVKKRCGQLSKTYLTSPGPELNGKTVACRS